MLSDGFWLYLPVQCSYSILGNAIKAASRKKDRQTTEVIFKGWSKEIATRLSSFQATR